MLYYTVIYYTYTHYALTLLIQPNSLVPLRLVLTAVDGHSLLYI